MMKEDGMESGMSNRKL